MSLLRAICCQTAVPLSSLACQIQPFMLSLLKEVLTAASQDQPIQKADCDTTIHTSLHTVLLMLQTINLKKLASILCISLSMFYTPANPQLTSIALGATAQLAGWLLQLCTTMTITKYAAPAKAGRQQVHIHNDRMGLGEPCHMSRVSYAGICFGWHGARCCIRA